MLWERLLFRKLLGQEPPGINEERCLNRAIYPVSCRLCVVSCPHNALAVSKSKSTGRSKIYLHTHRCRGCYFCVRTCPTRVFSPRSCEYYQRFREIAVRKHPVIGCVHANQKTEITFPCIFSIDPDFLFAVALKMAEEKKSFCFYMGECRTCSYFKFHPHSRFIQTVKKISELLKAANAHASLELLWTREEVAARVTRFSRRGLLQQLQQGTRKTLKEAAEDLFPSQGGSSLSAGKQLFLIQLKAYSGQIFYHLAPRVFRKLKVDPDRCNGCGVCVKSCHFHALQKERTPGKEAAFQLYYAPWRCVHCGACREACPRDAIKSTIFYQTDEKLFETSLLINLERKKCKKCGRYFVLPGEKETCTTCLKKSTVRLSS